ncbi:MAG: N-acetylmuramic acid 6-phosphate etherase [Hyphomicrobiales bacterium]|nr:N-acetylmuramic acid 6-phosphate etherase [Hyphomicrobiales bacterium]
MRTEDLSPRFDKLDAWSSLEAVHSMFEGQLSAAAAVREALPAIAKAGEAAADRLAAGGRLVYAGAGASGRIGVQDGVELSPTFDWPEARVAYAIAGGERALMGSVEGAEDDRDAAKRTLADLAVGPRDVVIGLAASGATPYTVEFVQGARTRGALTIAVANNPGAALLAAAEHPISLPTGPEVVAGSTRMKAGTAQKVALNLLSTLTMIRLGRVYRGMMVDMRACNAKLARRARRMVGHLAHCDEETAERAFAAAKGDLKLAVLLARGIEPDIARTLIRRSGGRLRSALADHEA